jgi:hypothetical protein
MTRDTSEIEPDNGLRAAFRREGEYWTIAFAGTTCRLRDSTGLRHVAYLLARPGERIAAVDLVAQDGWQAEGESRQSAVGRGQEEGSGQWAVGGGQSEVGSGQLGWDPSRDAVPSSDTADCPNPTADCPPPTAHSLNPTADCPLPTADSATNERARVRVTHAIRHTLRRIETHHAELNEHLRATIKTGTSCAYLPDPRKAVRWEL